MSGFDLDERTPDLRDAVRFGAEEMATPSWYSGSLGAPFLGVARGAAKLNAVFNEVTGTLASPLFSAVDTAVGTDFRGFYRQEVTKRSFDWVDDLKPDPMTTGIAGQVLFSLADIGSTALVGGIAGGPAGAAVFAGMTEGEAYRQELLNKGVNPEAAIAAGGLRGLTTGVGVAIPLTLPIRGVAPNLVYGATVSAAQGAIDRAGTAEILRQSSRPEMAEQMQVLDMTAILTDAVLGAAFSGVAAGLNVRAQRRGEIDAAMAAQKAKHASVDGAPGIPATPEAAAAHSVAFEEAMRAITQDQEVKIPPEVSEAEFIARPIDREKLADMPEVIEQFHLDDLEIAELEPIAMNASGESAASLEAQSRLRQEAEAGQIRLMVSRDGTIRPLIGVDAVDQRARAGEVIIQKGIGAKEWTVLESGDGVSKGMEARAIESAKQYTPEAREEAIPVAEIEEAIPTAEVSEEIPAAEAIELPPELQAADLVVTDRPDLVVPLDDGDTTASEFMAQIKQELKFAQDMGKAFDAAVSCILGNGS